MATDPFLLDRFRNNLKDRNVVWTEKRMFGGDCFMVDDKMLLGTYKGGVIVRVDPDEAENLIDSRPATSQMMQAGRIMKGYLRVEMEGIDLEDDLDFWVSKCLEFNPKAKSSKKKR